MLYALGDDGHSHDVTTTNGCTDAFASEDHGEYANFFHVLTAKYTDKGGLQGTTTVALFPPHKQAEYFTSSSGIRIVDQASAENAKRIGDINKNDWIAFQPVNLKNIDAVSFRVSSPSDSDGSIELRTGSPTGPLVASQAVPSTGGWDTYVSLPDVKITDPGVLPRCTSCSSLPSPRPSTSTPSSSKARVSGPRGRTAGRVHLPADGRA